MACKVASGKGSAPMSFRHASNTRASSYRVSPCSYYVAANFFPFVTDPSPPISSLTFQIQGLIDSSFFSSLESLFSPFFLFQFWFSIFFFSLFFLFLFILRDTRGIATENPFDQMMLFSNTRTNVKCQDCCYYDRL